MKGSLGARLDRLEAALRDPNGRPQRVIRIVASNEEEAAAREQKVGTRIATISA